MASEQTETDRLLAMLTESAIDPSLDPILPSPFSTPGLDSTSSSSSSSSRPLNFSSAFSAQSSRPKRGSALAAAQNISQSYSHPMSVDDGFPDFSFLHDNQDLGVEDTEGGGGAIAGPGPNSIAAAVARNGIPGLEDYELPIPPPMNSAAFDSFLEGDRGQEIEQPVQIPQEVAPTKRKRGRPRTKPEKDPNAPPKKRGRPRKNPLPGAETTSAPTAAKNRRTSNAADSGDIIEEEDDLFGESEEDGQVESDSSAGHSSRGSASETNEGRRERRKRKKTGKKKRVARPLVPKVFRSANKAKETQIADLDVNDLIGEKDKEILVPELTEEQKRELQRAMNPAFATKLLETLEEHSDYYDRAYKALHEELLAVQVEESLLEHVKEIALEMRNHIRYPLKTMEQIELEETQAS